MYRIHNYVGCLTASLSGVLALVGGGYGTDAQAATLQVTNCNDSGPGSARAAVASAGSGDTIDLRGLSCLGIRLTSGPIAIAQNDLTLRGSGLSRFSISGNGVDSVIRHSGTGTLRLVGLTIANGYREEREALGGCIYSAGNIRAYDIEIRECIARGVMIPPRYYRFSAGAGAYAVGDIDISYSGIISNQARATGSVGGGLYAGGKLDLRHVALWDNYAQIGGGVYVVGALSIDDAIFRGNKAFVDSGAIRTQGDGPVTILNSAIYRNITNGSSGVLGLGGFTDKLIVNSTISGNRATGSWSVGVATGHVTITNSTIAFNSAKTCHAAMGGTTFHLESAIVANNTCGAGTGTGTADVDLIVLDDNRPPVEGEDNLVRSANVPLPADTIGADPMLLPLADNGGRTQTHAFATGSPAIDNGNNEAGLAYDQRGPGFSRLSGARTDIGAFERQQP
jgi:hypothetical protein